MFYILYIHDSYLDPILYIMKGYMKQHIWIYSSATNQQQNIRIKGIYLLNSIYFTMSKSQWKVTPL